VSEGSALCRKARKGRQEIRKGDIRQETGIRGNERGNKGNVVSDSDVRNKEGAKKRGNKKQRGGTLYQGLRWEEGACLGRAKVKETWKSENGLLKPVSGSENRIGEGRYPQTTLVCAVNRCKCFIEAASSRFGL